ncbi:MAG: hypothetical protein EPN36_12810 [Rhodanobacteraceae bacterium]|nr:MAG: hypothetical protein EPN36_12810 [Rhodanobacteraceae bacterium]
MPRNQGLQIEEQNSSPDRRVGFDAAAELAGLPYVRLTQRLPPPRDRRELWWLLALVLLGHALLGWVAWMILRPSLNFRGENGVITVSVIEPAASLPPPPLIAPPPPLPGQPPPPPTAPRRHLHYVPPAKGAIQATLQGVKGPPLDLYQSNGQIRMPPNAPPPPPSAPAYRTPQIQGSQIGGGKSPVPYKPTRFAQGFAPTNQSLGAKAADKIGEVYDKAVEKTTIKKTIKLPGGMKLHCAVAPLLLGGGCVPNPPQPPPKNDNDVRLSMPPPETLTGKKVPVPKSEPSVVPSAASSSH